MRLTFAVLTTTLFALAMPPVHAAHSETREYYVGESAMIVFMSNYYVGDWDVSGSRFHVNPGETSMRITMQGDASSNVLEVLDGQGRVLAWRAFCAQSGDVMIPPGARFVRVLAGADATAAALYPRAVACGVSAPPAHGFITADFV